MKHKFKKWHIILMSFMALFVAVFASLFNLKANPIDEEETPEELIDNWSISTFFYDSEIDNGLMKDDGTYDETQRHTPLTEINWDATNGSIEKGSPRIITLQINYKNTNTVTAYQPGELKIAIPNILYDNNFWEESVLIGANTATHEGEAWDFVSNINSQTYIFKNAEEIEMEANFEGSIQIVYILTPGYHSPEKFIEICKEEMNKEITASLFTLKESPETKIADSNSLNFYYVREFNHPWRYKVLPLEKTAEALPSSDGLPEGATNYTWVKYTFTISSSTVTSYPVIGMIDSKIEDTFPAECIVLNSQFNLITPVSDNKYEFSLGTWNGVSRKTYSIIVGYPKSIYNEEKGTLNITNTAYLYGQYEDAEDYTYQNEGTVSINLANFEFKYPSGLYNIDKSISYNNYLYYESLISQDAETLTGNKITSELIASAIYTGKEMDVKWGDDLLYISKNEKEYRQLIDDEYYFSTIKLRSLKNGNNIAIPNGKYNCELWVRYAGDSNYTLYEEFTNQYKTWSFTKEDAIVAYYFIVKNMKESLIMDPTSSSDNTIVINCANNIPTAGKIFNFGFIQVYSGGTLQNEPTINSYANFITKEEIAAFDQTTYGTYMQRSVSYANYAKHVLPRIKNGLYLKKEMSAPIQDAKNEIFKSTIRLYLDMQYWPGSISEYDLTTYGDRIPYEDQCIGWEFYDLLPLGMELTSSPEEIIASNNPLFNRYATIYDMNTLSKISVETFNERVRENTTIEITENWNNTGRTHIYIKVDLSSCPVFLILSSVRIPYVEFFINTQVSYDSYLEYGSTYQNNAWVEFYEREFKTTCFVPNNYCDMYVVNDTTDINSNNNTTEYMMGASSSITITSVISTHQDVKTFVKTDQKNYDTGIVSSSCNSEYEYKLRVRTGVADVTNLILYTNIEEAQQGKSRWKGEFLGFDTSYAENKGYNVKTYYSKNPTAGNLYNENGTLNSDWKEYIAQGPAKQGITLKFNEQSKTEAIGYDYVVIYYKENDSMYRLGTYGGSTIAGQSVYIPTNDFYVLWHTDSSGCGYYGFSIDSISYTPEGGTVAGQFKQNIPGGIEIEEITGNTYPDSSFNSYTHGNYGNSVDKIWHYTYNGELEYNGEKINNSDVKSLAFEYLDENGSPAIIPSNSLTYVLIQMKSPSDESITTLARMDCRTQWNALDEFGIPVQGITGINSNVVKVALPNSVLSDEMANISLNFIKEINGTDTQFENMKLDKADNQIFVIKLTSLTENDDGSYNHVIGMLSSTQGLVITKIPAGSYLLEELNGGYFNFIDFCDNNDPEIIFEGITFERTDQGYILTISENISGNAIFNIKVTNEIKDERYYHEINNKENLFLINKEENPT